MAKEQRSRGSTEPALDGRGVRLGIAASEYHREVTDAMLEEAVGEAQRLGSAITRTLRVPGVYDLPLAVSALLRRPDVDAVVTLGAVVKGETDHDQVIVHAVARKLLDLSVERDKPVALGVTGPGETLAQAKARVDRGGHAVRAAVQMVLRLREP